MLDLVEKYLIRLAALSVLLLVLVQGLMTSDPIRFYLSWGERLEGQTISFPVNATEQTLIEEMNRPGLSSGLVRISTGKYASLPRAGIMVNGKIKKYFDRQIIEIEVRGGDKISIDSTFYRYPIAYEITACSNNLAFPCKGQTYVADQSVVMIGEVVVK
jgi:hypothetical protein